MIGLYDHVILGDGPLGRLVAHQLAPRREKILIVDSGVKLESLISTIRVDTNIKYVSHEQAPSLNESWGRNWYGAIQDLQFQEYRNAFNGCGLSVQTLNQLRDILSKILDVKLFNFESNTSYFSRDYSRLLDEQFLITYAKIIRNPLLSKLSEEIKGFSNVEYLNDAIVRQLIPYKDETHVRVLIEGKTEEFVSARNTWAALGTIENTRLLLNSKIVRGHPSENFLGCNLSDHLSINLGNFDSNHMSRLFSILARRRTLDGGLLWPRLVLKPNLDDDRLGSFIHGSHFTFNNQTSYAYRFMRRLQIEHIYSPRDENGKLRLLLFLEKKNEQSNRIVIQKSSKLDMPNLEIKFHLGHKEFQSIIAKSVRYLTGLVANDLITGIENLDSISVEDVTTSVHPSGTFRMSSRSDRGVIDPFSRLWVDPKIRVLGAGAFPRAFAIHPTFLAMMLALLAVKKYSQTR